ncbi:hypothetical protein L1987_38434 [Smallanthus sonchifolius]|uniref:Uncharacterized protein n=1 Tax=Smallanthus sonchifolius TaxID=185202 RepID=A0ACB9HKK6_9ASTR|nr:hypothetical protein L1987_38434 [Smallanthus sonchifolius]
MMVAATSTTDWNQNLLCRVQEGKNTFSTIGDGGLVAEIEAEHQVFTADQQQSLDFATISNACTTFPISSTSYGYSSSLVQSLFNSNSQPSSPQLFYDFQSSSNNLFSSASTSSLDHNISSFFPTPSSQFLRSTYKEKESFPNLTIEHEPQEIRDLGSSTKKSAGELPFKRPRLETPSPLPTFKVRKEKLGDRITALQQLVSPFGKTDTASVLHEAIEYIKLLHDQVNILSAPYMKGASKQLQLIHDKVNDKEQDIQTLRSQGLCLVPVSSMFPVATEMATGFWTPSYEGSFK